MNIDSKELKDRYENIALSRDYSTTACDYNLRELEIDTAVEYISDGDRILDVGCGLGYSVVQYAGKKKVEAYGIDYAENMINVAQELLRESNPDLLGTVNFQLASVTNLPYPEGHFDVVTSSRCLMALLDWELQKSALLEIHRVLKPGGCLVLMEGTFEGLARLNAIRKQFGLEEIPADGRDRLFTLKFEEEKLLRFCRPVFALECKKSFGMYYFITRIIQPLLVHPDPPRYDHKLNEVARKITSVLPDFHGMGHLVAFILIKRR
jgi:ubiquinone/menaquinone biosynthesis C-methylase UbiE